MNGLLLSIGIGYVVFCVALVSVTIAGLAIWGFMDCWRRLRASVKGEIQTPNQVGDMTEPLTYRIRGEKVSAEEYFSELAKETEVES